VTAISNKKRAKVAVEKMTSFDLRLLKRISDGNLVTMYEDSRYEESIQWLEGFELIFRDDNRWVVSLAGQYVLRAI
jgi:hypothetical protein